MPNNYQTGLTSTGSFTTTRLCWLTPMAVLSLLRLSRQLRFLRPQKRALCRKPSQQPTGIPIRETSSNIVGYRAEFRKPVAVRLRKLRDLGRRFATVRSQSIVIFILTAKYVSTVMGTFGTPLVT